MEQKDKRFVMKKNAGKSFPLDSNKDILEINSPQHSIYGPWFVVHKDLTQRWAIVIIHWKETPCLGIRWFNGNQGTPSVRGFATWLVIPDKLSSAVLSQLPIAPSVRKEIDDILSGESKIEELKKKF